MKMNSNDISTDYHIHSTFSVDGQDTMEALGWRAVSYTHLDVYKRQVWANRAEAANR